MSACDNNQQNYTTVIPKNSTSVVEVNMKNLVEKSDFVNSPILAMAKQSMGLLISNDAKKKFDIITDDPSLMGIDFSLPAYLFRTPDNYVGMSFCVEDESLLDEFINTLSSQSLCTKAKEHDGKKWCKLLDDINLAYDDNTLLLLVYSEGTNISTSQNTEKVMRTMFEHDDENTFMSSVNGKKLAEMNSEDVVVYSNLAAVPKELLDDYKSILPVGAQYSDVNILIGADFLKGNIKIKSLLYSNNDKVQKLINDNFASLKPIHGQYLNNIPKNTSCWACFGSNGKKGLEQIKKIPQIKELLTALNLGIDADNIIRAIDGDVLILSSKSSAKSNSNNSILNITPEKSNISIIAQLDNSGFMKDMDYWMQSSKDFGVNITSYKNYYRLKFQDYDCYMDVKNKDLYFGTTPSCLSLFTNKKLNNANEAIGKYFYAKIDMHEQIPLLSTIIISSSSVGELTINIKTANIMDNVLKQIIKSAIK